MNNTNTTGKMFYRAKDVAKFLGIGLSTVWLWVKTGRLPKPIKLSTRVTVWNINDIRRCVEGRYM